MSGNPIKEWLARVADECGSPASMLMWASNVRNENTRKLIAEYALLWQRKFSLEKGRS